MSEKMELAELAQRFRNNASAVLTGDQVADEILNWAADFTIVRASSPAQEPVTTEPVARLREIVGAVLFANWSGEEDEPGTTPWKDWTGNLPMNSVGLGKTHFLETADQLLASLPSEVLAIPAPPQPGREWLPIVGMEWPAMPVMLGFWYQGAFKQYIAEHDPAGWMEQGKRTFYPSHMQGWFTHWQPLSAPPAGEPE